MNISSHGPSFADTDVTNDVKDRGVKVKFSTITISWIFWYWYQTETKSIIGNESCQYEVLITILSLLWEDVGSRSSKFMRSKTSNLKFRIWVVQFIESNQSVIKNSKNDALTLNQLERNEKCQNKKVEKKCRNPRNSMRCDLSDIHNC